MTVGDPGVHGAVTGTHGVGVNTPLAAAVALAVVGFARDEQTPNGGIFDTGIESRMLAAIFLSAVTVGNVTISVDGAAPKVQDILADKATNCAIRYTFRLTQTILNSSLSKSV
jgi:hypothetical protein